MDYERTWTLDQAIRESNSSEQIATGKALYEMKLRRERSDERQSVGATRHVCGQARCVEGEPGDRMTVTQRRRNTNFDRREMRGHALEQRAEGRSSSSAWLVIGSTSESEGIKGGVVRAGQWSVGGR